jgi:hypothetical protein
MDLSQVAFWLITGGVTLVALTLAAKMLGLIQ